MINQDSESLLLAIQEMKKKLRKLEMEYEMGISREDVSGTEGDLNMPSKGVNNEVQQAMETGEVGRAAGETAEMPEGEGEVGTEIEIEIKPEDEDPMERLHKRMREEMGSMPKSHSARAKTSSFGG